MVTKRGQEHDLTQKNDTGGYRGVLEEEHTLNEILQKAN